MRRTAATLWTLLLAAGFAAPPPSSAQTVQVRLDRIGDPEGPVQARFASALRTLEGVEVVEPPELADYALAVSALCTPDADRCESAGSYSVSVVLSEPLTAGALRAGLRRTGDEGLPGWEPGPEARRYLQRYRQIHAVWTTSWGPDRLSAGVESLVRGIDARCFEKRRLVERRAALEGGDDPEAARALASERYAGQRWLC